jgi:Flp pilus assembly pilin Flp
MQGSADERDGKLHFHGTVQTQDIRKLAGDKRGAVTTEYIVLVGTVALGLSAAIFALGPGLVASYEKTRNIVASP